MLMRAGWSIAYISMLLSCEWAKATPVDPEIAGQKGKQLLVRPVARKGKAGLPILKPISPVADPLLESLLEKTEGSGHLNNEGSQGSPESHQDFLQWMEAKFEGSSAEHMPFQNHDRSSRIDLSNFGYTSSPRALYSSATECGKPLVDSPIVSHASSSQSNKDARIYRKGSSSRKRSDHDRWHLVYDKVEQNRLRKYYNGILEEYGWMSTGHSSLRNRMIRNTPVALRDRIAKGHIVRRPGGGHITKVEDGIRRILPSRRKPRWTNGLSNAEEALVLQFGDRLLSHRGAQSDSARNKLLSSLTSSEIHAIKTGDQAKMNRIEAEKMPKVVRHKTGQQPHHSGIYHSS